MQGHACSASFRAESQCRPDTAGCCLTRLCVVLQQMGLLGEDRQPAAVAALLRFCPALNKVWLWRFARSSSGLCGAALPGAARQAVASKALAGLTPSWAHVSTQRGWCRAVEMLQVFIGDMLGENDEFHLAVLDHFTTTFRFQGALLS